MFPLGTVLFPGLVLPLHIFEERYRTLVRELVAQPDDRPQEFGVVLLRRGTETVDAPGADPTGAHPSSADPADADPAGPDTLPELHEVGCTAELRQVTELPDGRFDIVTVGRRRFRVVDLHPGDKPYLTAEVQWLPDGADAAETAVLAERVLTVFQKYLALVQPGSPGLEEIPEDPTVLSHLVAASAQLTVADRQALLAAADTPTRLRAELRLLSREAALLRQVRAVPVPLSELARPASPN